MKYLHETQVTSLGFKKKSNLKKKCEKDNNNKEQKSIEMVISSTTYHLTQIAPFGWKFFDIYSTYLFIIGVLSYWVTCHTIFPKIFDTFTHSTVRREEIKPKGE